MSKSVANATQWRNWIVGHTEEDPAQLLANPLNFRRHPGAQREALRGSISELGWIKAVLVNRTTGHVIDGHARCEEAITAGATVPVDWVEMTEAEERLALAVLDPITEMATRDGEALAALLAEVETQDAGLQALLDLLTAEVEIPIESGLAPGIDEDFAPDTPAEAITQPGDLILLGRHRLMCGDSTSLDAVNALRAGSLFDLLWTDPPYGVSYIGKTKDALTIQNDSLDDSGLEELLRGAFGCALATCRAGASWYVAAPGGPLHHVFSTVLKEMGIWRQTLNWVKNSFALGRSDYHYRHEPIFYGWKEGAAHYFVDDRTQDTILQFDKPARNDVHPTMKPVALVEKCIQNSSRPGDKVLDLFGGSGSTLIACEKTGRTAYLMELDPRYCDVIVTRWELATGQKVERHKEAERCHK